MPNPFRALLTTPLIQRVAFHVRRVGSQTDRHFFTSLLGAVVAFVAIAAIAVTLIEDEKRTIGGLGSSFYWSVTTIIGSGDPSYVNSMGGYIVGCVLAFFGVAFVAGITGAVVGFVIDFLLKEGQGMGAAGFRDHFIVCGWYIGCSVDELSSKLRGEHRATLLAVTRDGRSILNPPADFHLQAGADAVVVAEGLGTLRPLELQQG